MRDGNSDGDDFNVPMLLDSAHRHISLSPLPLAFRLVAGEALWLRYHRPTSSRRQGQAASKQAYLCSGVGFLAQIRVIDVVAILPFTRTPSSLQLPPRLFPPGFLSQTPSSAATGEPEREKQTESASELKQRQSLIEVSDIDKSAKDRVCTR